MTLDEQRSASADDFGTWDLVGIQGAPRPRIGPRAGWRPGRWQVSRPSGLCCAAVGPPKHQQFW